MKAILLATAILFVVGSATCFAPPKLPQQFTANYTLVFDQYVPPTGAPSYFGGFVAFDYVNGALHLELGGEEFVPFSFHTNINIIPDKKQGTLTGYWFEGPLCWSLDPTPMFFMNYFPFQIPANATSLGYQTINGEPCTGWAYTLNLAAFLTSPLVPVNMWVSSKTGSIVRVSAQVEYFNQVHIDFYNTVLGPFSSSLLTIPNKYCQSVPFRK